MLTNPWLDREATEVSLALAVNPTPFMDGSPSAILSKHATGFTKDVCFHKEKGLQPPKQQNNFTHSASMLSHATTKLFLGKLIANAHKAI